MLPSSYALLLVVIVIGVIAVKILYGNDASTMGPNILVGLFFASGILICISYFALYRCYSLALLNLITIKFGCGRHDQIGEALESAIEAKSIRFNHRRNLSDVQKQLRPFLDRNYFEGVEEEEKLARVSSEVMPLSK